MKPYIIFNPGAGSVSSREKIVSRLKRLRPVALKITRRSGDAERWAHAALRTKCDCVVAAGGDGTLNGVVNGIAGSRRRIGIGIVPLGTGNDFVRTLGLPLGLEENIDILRTGKERQIDLVRVTSKRVRYFVNVSAGGFSGMVDAKITAEIKRTWGPLAYLRGAAAALPDLHSYEARILLDDAEEISAQLYNIVIANGRFVAGGFPIAPDADPSDGLLDIVLIPKLGAPEMALLAAEIILGKHLSNNATIFRRAKTIELHARPGMWFNVDGELVGNAPAVFQIVPQRLSFIVSK
jgi:diacylglycerol kinase (ATP)